MVKIVLKTYSSFESEQNNPPVNILNYEEVIDNCPNRAFINL